MEAQQLKSTTTAPSFPDAFPELPLELILHILSFACHTSHETALSISLLSSWVRATVLPFVFSTVVRRAGPTTASTTVPLHAGWATPQGIHPSAVPLSQKSYSHLLLPTTCDVGKFVKHLWIETIDMMSSPGELSIFNACTNIEDVALTAGSLRLLYNSTLFGKKRGKGIAEAELEQQQRRYTYDEEETLATRDTDCTIGAASRIRSVTLTKHTFRYDWHFLVDLHSTSGTHASFLANITHLRLTDMEKSQYIPIDYLPNVTHLALPYLQLRTNRRGDISRIPDDVLLPERPTIQVQRGPPVEGGDPPTTAQRETTRSMLKMIILTVDEREWLSEPGRYGAHAKEDSPRQLFKALRDHAQGRDRRIHVVLSPRHRQEVCGEWARAARGNEDSVWELAEKTRGREEYGDCLPLAFPQPLI